MSRVTAYICTTIQRDVNGSDKREDFAAPTLPELIDHLVGLCSSSCKIQGIWELREGPDGHDAIRALCLDEHPYTDPMRKW